MLARRITKRSLISGAAALAAVALGGLASPHVSLAQKADPAQGKIETFYVALLDCMKNAKTLGLKGRFDKLAPVVNATFDVPAMTKSAVGPGWEQIPAAQQAAATEALGRMMIATYASRFDDFTGEKFAIDGAAAQGSDTLIKTRIVQSNGKVVPIDYLMRGGKVVDIHLDGTISELAGRRAEFGSILKSGGPDALIASLKAKSDKLMAGG